SPGESIPITFIKLGLSLASSIIKSSPSTFGLHPLQVFNTLAHGNSFIVFLLFSIISSRPLLEVDTPPSACAFGPSNKFPSTVGVTKTPLPNLDGTWNNVFLHIPPATLSNKQYSPFTGLISYLTSFIRLFKYAPPNPLAFIIILASKFLSLSKVNL